MERPHLIRPRFDDLIRILLPTVIVYFWADQSRHVPAAPKSRPSTNHNRKSVPTIAERHGVIDWPVYVGPALGKPSSWSTPSPGTAEPSG